MSSQHLTLMVPGLVWPDAELRAEATRDLALPALAWLLGGLLLALALALGFWAYLRADAVLTFAGLAGMCR